MLSLVKIITIGTYIIATFLSNFSSPATVDIIQLLFQYNSRLILQLPKGTSNDHQKLLKCFSGTTSFSSVSFSFAPSSPAVFIITADLNLNDIELIAVKLSGFLSLVSSLFVSFKLAQTS